MEQGFFGKKDSYKKANCGKCKKSLLDTKPINLRDTNFDEVVVNSDLPVIVDFWAPWCGPCKMVGPVIEELAEDFDGKAKICKVNTDEEQDIAVKYGIRSIPTILFFKDGELVEVKSLRTLVSYEDKLKHQKLYDKLREEHGEKIRKIIYE